MKYKTKIELITQAENKNEAMEIVGEYLSGYLASGVDMKCSTKRISNYNRHIISIAVTSLILTIVILLLSNIKPSKNSTGNFYGINAVQPPLRTSIDGDKSEFKKEWDTRQTREALSHIKK